MEGGVVIWVTLGPDLELELEFDEELETGFKQVDTGDNLDDTKTPKKIASDET